MEQRKIRLIVKKKDGEVNGIAIPKEIAILNKETLFRIKQQGSNILLESGCKLEFSKEDIEKYGYEDCKI